MVLKLVDVTWSPMGAMRANKVMSKLEELVGDVLIEDLPIPVTTVATDLVRQREVWFQNGPLLRAIRASIAVPGVITPVNLGEQVLVDGGLLNPLPMMKTDGSPKGGLEISEAPNGDIWQSGMYQGGIYRWERATGKIHAYKIPDKWQTASTQESMVSPQHSNVDGYVWTNDQQDHSLLRLKVATGEWEQMGETKGPDGKPIKSTVFLRLTEGPVKAGCVRVKVNVKLPIIEHVDVEAEVTTEVSND